MKHLGITSLCIGSLMFALLDMAPIPGGCSDRHHNGSRHTSELQECAVTGKVLDSGSTWAEISGKVYPDDIPPYCNPSDFGVEYKESGGTSESFSRIVVADENSTNFTVRIEGLTPNTKYEYRTFFDCTNHVNYYGETYSFTTKEDLNEE